MHAEQSAVCGKELLLSTQDTFALALRVPFFMLRLVWNSIQDLADRMPCALQEQFTQEGLLEGRCNGRDSYFLPSTMIKFEMLAPRHELTFELLDSLHKIKMLSYMATASHPLVSAGCPVLLQTHVEHVPTFPTAS